MINKNTKCSIEDLFLISNTERELIDDKILKSDQLKDEDNFEDLYIHKVKINENKDRIFQINQYYIYLNYVFYGYLFQYYSKFRFKKI
jgi:hypothetical protein